MVRSSRARLVTFLFLVAVLIASGLQAQTTSATTGAINGKVTDKTNAVLPGVTITIASPSLMGTRTAVTGEDGFFRFAAVPPGDYTVIFELAGFTTLKREGIHVALGFTATVNGELGVASLQENVTVTGASPVVDTQSTAITTNFNAQTLASLPSARDMWAILAESPAVSLTRIDVGGSAAGTQTGYTVYGTTGQNRPTVEGIVATEGTDAAGFYYDYGSFEDVNVETAATARRCRGRACSRCSSRNRAATPTTAAGTAITRTRSCSRSTSTRARRSAARRAARPASRPSWHRET